jgi:hypothetical protein
VRAAYSYLASNDPRVHLGLGTATRVDSLEVKWPDGTVETYGPFDADRVVLVRQGTGTRREGKIQVSQDIT